MKKSIQFAAIGAILGMLSVSPVSAAPSDCSGEAASVKGAIKAKPAEILVIVEKSVSANPDCSCEIVKAAIESSKGDPKTVVAIVRTAATAAPGKTKTIAKCAASVAPDSVDAIQALVNELLGEGNPLDFPTGDGDIVVGPQRGEGGGYSVAPPGLGGSGFGPVVVAPPAPPTATPTSFIP